MQFICGSGRHKAVGELPKTKLTATASNTNINGWFPADTRDYAASNYGGVFSQTYLNSQANGENGNSRTYKYTLNANVLPTVSISEFGSNQSHENMPPFISIFCWKRIA